ncbi:hypothetical protein H4217_001928 [Coemansia sp. RSA 1939]|nr:hypothetical protein H4217_001928 [Coemansia sp. RSA 1939]
MAKRLFALPSAVLQASAAARPTTKAWCYASLSRALGTRMPARYTTSTHGLYKAPTAIRLSCRRSIFTQSAPKGNKDSEKDLDDSQIYGISALCIAITVALAVYFYYYGKGGVYPTPIRNMLREGGAAYMRPKEKQDLPKALKCYKKALELLDELGKKDINHGRDAAHVTGLVARVATIYSEMGDLDNAIVTYNDLMERILSSAEMADPKLLVKQLMHTRLSEERRSNILRALGCASKLAETLELRAARWRRRSMVLADPALAASSADLKEAGRWYQWCLQVVTLTYQNHFNHIQLDKGLEPTSTPSFDPATLPKFFSIEIVTSLFYNAATYFSNCAQYDMAAPLLQRALDLLRPAVSKGDEEGVCRSAVLMSHLANAAARKSDLQGAEKILIDGLSLAKRFSKNSECLNSFVALTYSLGTVYQTAGKTESARVQYRQAIDVAATIGDKEAAQLATEALNRA